VSEDPIRGYSFDEVTRGMASGKISRRRALKLFAATALASVLPARLAAAQPGCRKEGHPCEGNQECCPGLVCRVTGPGNAKRYAKPKRLGTKDRLTERRF
jgi:hypothetical protein